MGMVRTETEIIYTTCVVLCFSTLYTTIVLSLALSNVESNLPMIGWSSVIGASFIFSTTTIPYKTPSLIQEDIDPLLFSVFTGIGIFIVSVPIMIYLLVTNQQQFLPFSALGSFFIFMIGVFSYNAVSRVGVSLGPASWASVGMCTAFVIGLIIFDETIDNLLYACIAMCLLVIGITSVVLSKGASKKGEEDTGEESEKMMTEEKDENGVHGLELEMSSPLHDIKRMDDIYNDHNKSSDSSISDDKRRRKSIIDETTSTEDQEYFLGFLYCLLTGLIDGSLMVPFKISFPTYPGTDTPVNGLGPLKNGINYLSNFGVASLVVMPGAYLLYKVMGSAYNDSGNGNENYNNHGNDGEEEEEEESGINDGPAIPPTVWRQVRIAFWPGCASGMLWALANINSVIATSILNMSIAFPLTQTCCLWATLIGLLYFGETVQYRTVLFVGVLCILTGSFFLVTSK